MQRRSCAVTFCHRPIIACSAASTKHAGREFIGRMVFSTNGFAAGTRLSTAHCAMKDGEPRLDFRIAAEAVAATGLSNPRLLEIGCGSGYYSEVLDHVASRRRSLYRHRLFRGHDRPRARTLSGDRVRGRRCNEASLRRSGLRHRLQRRIADAHHRLSSRHPRSARVARAFASSTACRCSTITGPPISANMPMVRRWSKWCSESRN